MQEDNYFSPSFGNRPSLLVGRADLIASVLEGLETAPGSKERAVVMTGQRGTGKTVLLWEFADRARKAGFAVVNPTAIRSNAVRRMCEKLEMEAASLLRQRKHHVSGGSVGVLGFSAGVSLEREQYPALSNEGRMVEAVRGLSARGIGTLFLVDELQSNSEEVRSLIGAYQEMVGEGLNVAIVLAGLPAAVAGILNDHVLTFLNRARKIELEPLNIGEVDAYYMQAFEKCGVDVASDLRRQASKATAGFPYLMQLIGHYVILYSKNGVVDGAALEEAVLSAGDEFKKDVCETTLASLSGKDIEYLRAMAEVVENGEAQTSSIASRMGVTSDYGQQYRKRLLAAGVVQKRRRGTLKFAMPYLCDYLREMNRE